MRWPIDFNPRVKEKIFDAVIFILIIFLGAAIYCNTFDVPFVFDDVFTVIENPAVRSIHDIKPLWRYDPSRFLTHFTFALNFHFGKTDVYGYHVVNLVIHLLASGACYLLLRLLLDNPSVINPALFPYRRRIAVFAALLFFCHPIQTQAVTYISQRSTPLAALCYLSSLVFYIRFREKGGWKNYVFSLGFAFLGLFTKPIIISLPAAMALCEISFLSRPGQKRGGLPQKKRVYVGLLPFFSMLIIVPALLLLWRDKAFEAGQLLSMTRESFKYSRWEYFLTELNVIMTYAGLLFFPVNQKLDYDFPIARNFFSFPTWYSFLAIVTILYLAVRVYRKHKVVSFGLFWIAVTLSLESSVFPISDVIFEHRLYLPMVGFALIISYALARLTANRPKVFFVIACLILIVCGTLTYRRNGQWRDALIFYQDMADRFPNKSRILNNLGNYYVEKKEWDTALKYYQKALELGQPNEFSGTSNNIANVYSEQGRFDEAIRVLEGVVARDPLFEAAYYNLGGIYISPKYKDYSKAMMYFTKTLEINSMFAPAIVGIANIYGNLNQWDKAKFYLEQAKAVNPGYAPIYEDLGHYYLARKQYEMAFNYYQEALRRNPNVGIVHNNLGNLYAMQGRNDLALVEYRTAIQCNKEFAGAYKNLADLLKQMGRLPEARPYYQKALELFQKENNGFMIEQIKEQLGNPS